MEFAHNAPGAFTEHGEANMKNFNTAEISCTARTHLYARIAVIASALLAGSLPAQDRDSAPPQKGATSYDQISPALLGKESFQDVMAKDKAGKAAISYDNAFRAEKITRFPEIQQVYGRGIPMICDSSECRGPLLPRSSVRRR